MIKTAIFDFDGTLANTPPLCYEAFRRAVRDLVGRCPSDEEVEKCFGPDDLGVIRLLIPERPDLHEQGRALYVNHYEQLHAALAPAAFDGAADLLRHLQNMGIQLAMVTGKAIETADISLRFYGLNEFFSVVETGSPTGGVKPERIRSAMARLNADPAETIYIGDAPTDIDACREVGIRILSAAWAPNVDKAALQARQPDYLLYRFEDMRDFFTKHAPENLN